jgi:hypothetical protein
MPRFTESERAHLLEMRALKTNERGRDVLVGLTEEESDFVVEYGRQRLRGEDSRLDRARYLNLNGKHERTRLAIIGAEIASRDQGLPIN